MKRSFLIFSKVQILILQFQVESPRLQYLKLAQTLKLQYLRLVLILTVLYLNLIQTLTLLRLRAILSSEHHLVY